MSEFWYREYARKAASGNDIAASGRGDRFSVAEYLQVVGHVVASLGPARSERVVDIGCGNGLMEIVLAPLVRELIGVEPVDALVRQARANTAGAPNVRILFGEGHALPVAPGSVDAVLCYGVLQLVEEPERVEAMLVEMARVLVPGGRALVGGIPDLTLKEQVLGPYLDGVRAAAHLSDAQKAEILERNRRGRWFDPGKLAADAERAGFHVAVRRPPAHLSDAAERFELWMKRGA